MNQTVRTLFCPWELRQHHNVKVFLLYLEKKFRVLEKEYLLYKFKYPDNYRCFHNYRCFLSKLIWNSANVTYDMMQMTVYIFAYIYIYIYRPTLQNVCKIQAVLLETYTCCIIWFTFNIDNRDWSFWWSSY